MSDGTTEKAERSVFVVAVDDTQSALEVIRTAASWAAKTPGSELHLVHVVDWFAAEPPPELANQGAPTQQLERARVLLERLADFAHQSFSGRIVGHMAAGAAWKQVVQFAADLAAKMIFVGTRDLSTVRRFWLGSVSEQIVRKAQCPVVVVRPTDYHARDVPEIEPACPDCLEVQRATNGQKLWCERHSHRHPQAHLHYEKATGYGAGSMLLR